MCQGASTASHSALDHPNPERVSVCKHKTMILYMKEEAEQLTCLMVLSFHLTSSGEAIGFRFRGTAETIALYSEFPDMVK